MMAPGRLGAASLLVALTITGGARPARASDWDQIGLEGRPAWVSAAVERRLRLLSALPSMEDTLTARAKAYLGNAGPGLSVGLVLDDGLYYSRGFGFRDAEKQHAPDEQTIFCIGSMTKVFTATTLLALRDAGKLSLDDLTSKHVPEIKKVKNPACRSGDRCSVRVKLRHLVSHTAGLPNEMSPAIADEQQWIEELQRTRLAYWPGSFGAYSGVALEMAGLVVQRVSGKPYTKAVTDLLLNPLGMKSSGFDMQAIPARQRAQNWKLDWNPSFTAPRFSADSDWPDRKMLTAAGYLLTSLSDLSRFHRIWLAKKAPHDVLKETTLADARRSAIGTGSGAIPPGCGDFKDASGAGFSACGDARDFGVGWYVGQIPYIQHNGSTGLCGSNSVLSPDDGMGATGLVSTQPFPAVPEGHTQPSDIDPGFMSTVVTGMLTSGVAADKAASSWQTSALGVGMARYLWLMGVKLPSSMLNERRDPPQGRRGAPLHPGGAPDPAERPESHAFKELFLAQFSDGFRSAHHLNVDGVADYVGSLREQIGSCSTFRVRKALSGRKLAVRLDCSKAESAGGGAAAWDATLTFEQASPHRIAEIDGDGITAEPY